MKNSDKDKFEHYNQIWQNVVVKALSDESFKERLLKNPNQMLEKMGIEIPKGMTFHVHENTSNSRHLVLPKQLDKNLSEEELMKVYAAARGPNSGWT